MGNWKLTRSQEPGALTEPVLREMRLDPDGRSGQPRRRRGMQASGPSADVIEPRGEPLRLLGPEALVLGVRQGRDRLGLVPDAVDVPLRC